MSLTDDAAQFLLGNADGKPGQPFPCRVAPGTEILSFPALDQPAIHFALFSGGTLAFSSHIPGRHMHVEVGTSDYFSAFYFPWGGAGP